MSYKEEYEKSINVTKEVNHIRNIANILRGTYKPDKYKDVIIPMLVIRRLECALEPTKKELINNIKEEKEKFNKIPPEYILTDITGYDFYNTSEFSLKKLLNSSKNIKENFKNYLDGFSTNIIDILNNLQFDKEIDKMDDNNRLYNIIKKFSELDLNPKTIDAHTMGYMFEELIRQYSENTKAGEDYTPREVIKLLVNIITAEGCDDLLQEKQKIVKVLDMACGTGGMLSTTFNTLNQLNPDIDVRLYGQEINDESYAICLADMYIKGQNANIRLQDTIVQDAFQDEKMRIVICNPPFGTPWGGKNAPKGLKTKVEKEYDKGFRGRFGPGLPSEKDMQFLFMEHAIDKMDDENGRAAIITNASPLFSRGIKGGESQIREYLIKEDLIEAIIALPNNLFYNTEIGIYAFILSKNKSKERKGYIQLINAVNFYKNLEKSIGSKRKEISNEDIKKIRKIYTDYKNSEHCKIIKKEEFLFNEYNIKNPIQRKGRIDKKSIERLENSKFFTNNSYIYNKLKYEELKGITPRSKKEEKEFNKYSKGKKFVEDVLKVLKNEASDKEFLDYSEFKKYIKSLLFNIEGLNDNRLDSIALKLSVNDKNAVIQTFKNGKIKTDPSFKDTEIVPLTKDMEEFMKQEVIPEYPDAQYECINSGAIFLFNEYFYKINKPKSTEKLFEEFMEIERNLNIEIENL